MDKRSRAKSLEVKQVWDLICQSRANVFAKEGYRKLIRRLKLPERILRQAIKTHGKKQDQDRITTPTVRRIPNLIGIITQALVDHPEKQSRGNWILRQGINQYRHIIEPTRPYQLWSGDWKEIKVPILGCSMYLFAIIDCHTREVMAWELSLTKDEVTAIGVSNLAYQQANQHEWFNPRKLIMHTDQGSAYTGWKYINWWRQRGVKLSTADKGKPTQNPYIEAFFSLLSRFHLQTVELFTIVEVNQSLKDFIDRYNREWLHSSLNYQSPEQKIAQNCLSKSLNYCPKMSA